MAKVVDYSFKILEEILMLKKYKSKEEVIKMAERMVEVAKKNSKVTPEIMTSYNEALNKLNSLSYEEMNEIIGILSSYDDE